MSHVVREPSSRAAEPHPTFVSWLLHVASRMRLSRIVVLLVLMFVCLPFVVHYYLSGLSTGGGGGGRDARGQAAGETLDRGSDDPNVFAVLQQTDELRRIKVSVQTELRELESRRQKVLSEMAVASSQVDAVRAQQAAAKLQLRQVQLSITAATQQWAELGAGQLPPRPPFPLAAAVTPPAAGGVPAGAGPACRMHTCFDMSRCPLSGGLRVYLYPAEAVSHVDTFIALSVRQALSSYAHLTRDPDAACLFVVLVGDTDRASAAAPRGKAAPLQQRLQRLSHWRADGRNHVVLNLARHYAAADPLAGVKVGRAVVAQSRFTESQFRADFDVVLPPSLGASHGDVWSQLTAVAPARRRHLVAYRGQLVSGQRPVTPADLRDAASHRVRVEADVIAAVTGGGDDVAAQMEFSCDGQTAGDDGDWALCGTAEARQQALRHATFSLILAPVNQSLVSTLHFQVRVYEALKAGAVPVVLGAHVRMPFSELVDARLYALRLARARAPELRAYLAAFTDADVLALRRRGRHLWQAHFGTTAAIVDTLLVVLRDRLLLAAPPVREWPSPGVFSGGNTSAPTTWPVAAPPGDDAEDDALLGPIEMPFASPVYARNFSHDPARVARPGDLFHLYPHTPFAPVMPAEAKFIGSSFGFRPIANGEGGAGKEFLEALGGNEPREQFTVVMLTYQREAVLLNAIARLKALPYLNRVVVVWNSPTMPQSDLLWPDIGVPVNVIKTAKNSLNNRFLPYDIIETEAILSLDDDAHLRHDEILFAFRVWREARDRIVGFPGRFQSWDVKNSAWLYNSNYSCELSMVLTGAAFYHKYYSYLYTYVMPQAIRDKVDEYLNCEDLAMNFLVSHVTRKPPLKVTSRWTFRCPGCPSALYMDEEHFAERHRCINFFSTVYGYMPLLHTQFRLDSVLFKTRIPHDKQKCFKFI